jgi:hypothetical protein
MKGIICFAYLLLLSIQSFSQKKCGTSVYFKNEINKIPGYKDQQQAIEDFTNRYLNTLNGTNQLRINGVTVIKIPVVVHVLYHSPGQKISDDIISNQIKILNRDFRRKNPDTVLTPLAFKNVAADCEIEFQLATSDPWRFSTNGIIKKYTPVETWEADDKMKFDSEMGSNAWDSKKYLNIWVCNMGGLAGYSTLPGGDSQKDGVVIDFGAFNSNITGSDYNMGRTAVHEVGHWLNLKHIWGDSDCGDDGVSDTPKQEIYTVGCPTEIRKSCNNGAAGNMYMNYMDFTNDACMNMFSNGQKARMLSLFATGGVRESMLNSTGLSAPLVILTPIELPDPKWLFAKIYPNPVSDKMIFNLEYDSRWIGKSINVTNLNGQIIKVIKILSKDFEIDLSALQAGVYFLTAKKEDGDFIRHKFIKI